jgi:hypothetical protein
MDQDFYLWYGWKDGFMGDFAALLKFTLQLDWPYSQQWESG